MVMSTRETVLGRFRPLRAGMTLLFCSALRKYKHPVNSALLPKGFFYSRSRHEEGKSAVELVSLITHPYTSYFAR